MPTTSDGRVPPTGQSRAKGRPGPKPRGRTVVPLTITVTPAQRDALEAMADSEKTSISAVIRRFIAVGLAVVGLYVITALIEITIARHTDREKEAPGRRTSPAVWPAFRLRRIGNTNWSHNRPAR